MKPQKTNQKSSSLIAKSSYVTGALREAQAFGKEAKEKYMSLQKNEMTVAIAEKRVIAAKEEFIELQDKVVTEKQALDLFNKFAVVLIEQVQGVPAKSLVDFDRGDSAGLGARVAEMLESIPHIGPGLAKASAQLNSNFAHAVSKRDEAEQTKIQAERDWQQSVFHLESGLAVARGYLASIGVKAPTRKTKKPSAEVAAPTPAPTIVGG